MRVLVTGSREWSDRDVVRDALTQALTTCADPVFTVVHGANPRGADRWADEWARNHTSTGFAVERHPADWSMGKQAGHWRNQHMVNLGADLCLAFFQPGATNRGTADCVRRAEAAGIPVRRYPQEPSADQLAQLALEPDETPGLRARIDRVLALHVQATDRLAANECAECFDTWPCPTRRTLTQEEP